MSQTGCGDGDHWGGQRLAGQTAAQPLVTLKMNKNSHSVDLLQSKIGLLSVDVLCLCCNYRQTSVVMSNFNHMMSLQIHFPVESFPASELGFSGLQKGS